jgi:two-component system LytT family response regulator
MKLRVLIAEDEPLSRERLRDLLQAESLIEIVAECATGQGTLVAIRETQPDLVFLDVKMPGLDGFGVIQALNGARSPMIVFVTASERFALRAFDVHAVDYLLKPFDRVRFQLALERARERLKRQEGSRSAPIRPGAAAAEPRPKALERMTIKSQGRIAFVNISEIDWISAADNYVELHVGASTHLLRTTITALSTELPRTQFVRISRSILVNLDRIKEMRSKSHGDYLVVLHDGTSLVGTRVYRPDLASLLGNLS